MSRIEDPNFLVKRPILRSMGREKIKTESVKVDKSNMAIPQKEHVRNDEYLDLVRALPILVSGMGPCIVHHLHLNHTGGIGKKPDDSMIVPMMDFEHKTLHSPAWGDKRYWSHHGIDARLCAA